MVSRLRSRAGGLAAHALAGGEAELEIDDVDQMIEAQNARRRASGRHEISEDDVRAQVAADERWRQEMRRRARVANPPPGAGPPPAEAPPPADD